MSSAENADSAELRFHPKDCPLQPHERGMVYDPVTGDAVCRLCGKHEPTEQGSL